MPQGDRIHERSIVHKSAEIGDDVVIGHFSVIGPNVKIGDGTEISSNVCIEGWTEIGKNCQIGHGAVLGGKPQIVEYQGERSFVKIGDNNVIREYVTINRSGKEDKATIIGNNCYLMAYTHIAHDCQIGNEVVITNYTGLPGHIVVEDKVVISGYVGIHQFVHIGRLSMISGLSRISKDILPYSLIEGNPAKVRGINVIGLRRSNITPNIRNDIRQAFKLLFYSKLNTSQALEKIKNEIEMHDEIRNIVEFIESSERGLCK
ncbi:MAG: acyl-ACP--UDP-N-acetylglucosamine O-acyltransferase [Nitrospinae bacterium]|nr:acyl-ACP--UDP-N-acetylglucosamine O-acyltransferase [Nitrospinota bacterium]